MFFLTLLLKSEQNVKTILLVCYDSWNSNKAEIKLYLFFIFAQQLMF